MAIAPISSVSNNYKNLSFGRNNTNEENKPKMSTTTKVVIGSALAALAATGIYIATRGKAKSVPEKPIEQLKEMAVSQFKNAGNKFEKGKALTSTGEGYTGTLTHTTKDGKNIALKYENGFLVESKGGKFSKIYEYDDKGNLIKITDGKNTILSKNINGDITYVHLPNNPTSKGYITKNGKLKYVIGGDNTITFYNSDCSIPNGSKLLIQKAGTKHVRQYELFTPDGKHITYTCIPEETDGLTRLKEILVEFPNEKKRIKIEKDKDKLTGELYYYVLNKNGKSIERSIYSQKKELMEGPKVDDLLPILKDIKNIHKDIYRTLDDFGGVDKFSSRYC